MNHFIRFKNHPLTDPEIKTHLQPHIHLADFQNCPKIGDPTLHSLSSLPSLQSLRWIDNPSATPEGYIHLARHTHLHSLNVSSCAHFTNPAAQALLASPTLRYLDVSFCPLTDEAFTQIKAPLTYLNLQGCTALTDRTILALTQIPTLKHLYLAYNPQITNIGLTALKTLKLHTLKIYQLDI